MFHAPTTWVAPGAQGCLQVFVVGTDHAGYRALWQLRTTPSDGSSNWYAHGTPLGSNGLRWSPAVASSDGGRLDLFVVGDDLEPLGSGSGGGLYHQWHTARGNGWSGWLPRGTGGVSSLFGSPAVAPSPDGRLELFVLGSDGALWHTSQTAFGTGWSDMLWHGTPPGVLLSSAPAVAASADGRLEVFVASEDATLWHIRQTAPNSGWSDWVSHGTPSGVLFGSDSTPAIAPSADGRLELFTVGNDGALWHMWQTAPGGGWSRWQSHGAPAEVNLQRLRPAVALSARGRLELFVVGDDAALWHRCQTAPNGGWSRWVSHGAPELAGLMGSPVVVPSEDGRLELFVVGTDGALWHRWQTAPNAAWSPWFSHGTPPGSSLLPALTTG